MLFQHVYNWIKYKTLPPSILFKNRLFIERDSKFRRITNNLGLTFRNSKWTNLEMNNLHPKFLNSYFIILTFFFTIFFIIFTYIFIQYYSPSTIFNNVAFVFWGSIDLIDYYFTFIIWSTLIFLSTVFKGLNSYLFTSFSLNQKRIVKEIYLKKFNKEEKFEIFDNSYLSVYDYKWIVYNWLNSSNSQIKDHYIEQIFNFQNEKKNFLYISFFFTNLYKTFELLNKFNTNKNIFKLTSYLNNCKNNNLVFSYYQFLPNNVPFLFFVLSKKNSYFKNKTSVFTTSYNDTNFYWNLHFTNFSITNFFQLPSSFYKSRLNVNTFLNNKKFKEFFILSNNLINKNEISKNNRWLYRYSLVHRRNFKNTHKITLTKKLIGTGIVNKNISVKNLWHSEFISKFSKNNTFHFINNLVYNNHFQTHNTSAVINLFNKNYSNYNSILNCLSFYEQSFFWIINKFKYQNSLKLNVLTSTLKKHNNPDADFSYHSTNLIPLYLKNMLFWNPTLNFPYINKNYISLLSNNSPVTPKDVFINFQENYYFSNYDYKQLVNIVKNPEIIISEKSNTIHFNLLSNVNNSFKPSRFLFSTQNNSTDYITSANSFLNEDLNLYYFFIK